MKRVALFLVVCLLFSGFSYAKVIYNPDENTYWIEDGKNFEISEYEKSEFWQGKMWSGKLVIEETEDGFIIKSPSFDRYAIGRFFKFSPDYPYLVWEISKVVYGDGYKAFLMCFPVGVFGFEGNIFSGIFVVNMFQFGNIKDNEFCRIYLYDTSLQFKYIKAVKKPDNYIEITSPQLKDKNYVGIGDELIFRLILKEPAEDVSLTFYQSEATGEIKINNSSSLQLKPVDDQQKIWTGKIKIESIDKPIGNKEGYIKGKLLIKATVLGGKVHLPIWTSNYFEIKTTKEMK